MDAAQLVSRDRVKPQDRGGAARNTRQKYVRKYNELKEQRDVLDLLEDGRVLRDAHAEQLLRAPLLVQNVVGVLAELLHVRADEHLAKLDKVAVVFIVDLNHTPRV